MKTKLIIFVLLIGLLTACASPATEAPASALTEESAPVIDAPTNPPAPTDTAVVPTDTAVPALEPTLESTTAPVASTTVSFTNDILPLIQSRCKNCHGGNKTEEGLNLLSYANIIKGSDNGPVIVPGDSENSLLVKLVSSQEMPKRGPKLTPPQVQLIIDWVNQGAPNN